MDGLVHMGLTCLKTCLMGTILYPNLVHTGLTCLKMCLLGTTFLMCDLLEVKTGLEVKLEKG